MLEVHCRGIFNVQKGIIIHEHNRSTKLEALKRGTV
jgi:hypothetical protein